MPLDTVLLSPIIGAGVATAGFVAGILISSLARAGAGGLGAAGFSAVLLITRAGFVSLGRRGGTGAGAGTRRGPYDFSGD